MARDRGTTRVEGRPPAEPAPAEPDDARLVAMSRAGDHEAFAALVRRHAEVAFRAAYVVLGDADAAADAAQEGFIAMHSALGRFRAGEPVRPWLLTIVGNRARNLRRGAGRRVAAELRGEVARPRPAEPSAEQEAAGRERRARVLAAVNALAPEDRAVIACRYYLDLSEAETAALLAVAPGTVKSRLFRARERLRARLDDDGDGSHG
jgi:RNA polymerase sigma-70 factor (ECF subfamily)